MTRAIVIQDLCGERLVKPDQFPLRVGGGEQADVRLPNLGSQRELAYLGFSDGLPYVQAASEDVPVFRNDERLQASCWLENGDVIRVGDARIAYECDHKRMSFRLASDDPDRAARSPALSTHAVGETTIEPVEFRPTSAAGRSKHGRYGWPLIGLALLAFGVLLMCAAFLFTAKSVALRIDPPPARVKVKGSLFVWELAGRYLLRPGHYTLVAEKVGYKRLERGFEVTDQDNQEIAFRMAKLPGLLSVSTHPVDGASVVVDGEKTGHTPLVDLELAPGPHDILVESDRYRDFRTRVLIEGMTKRQDLEIVLKPNWASVSFSSDPSGASLWLDGRYIGATPLATDLSAGTYELDVKKDGYATEQTELVVVAEEPQTVPQFKLKEAPAIVSLDSTPTGANVLVGERYRGRTPLTLALTPGEPHTITLSKAGYDVATHTVTLGSAETKALELKLSAKHGVLFVTSRPVDAELYIDGVHHGTATQRVELTAIPHQLEIRKEGFESYRVTVTPRVGFPQEVNVALSPRGSVAPKSPPLMLKTSSGQEFRYMKSGRFTMGASRREQGRRANETLRPIVLTRAFYIGVKEVTNREFRQFKPGYSSDQIRGFDLNQDDQPVVRISWQEAAAYCNWLSERESLPPAYVKEGDKLVAADPMTTGYRLPTEAEWAWAARFAGNAKSLKYPWGGSFPPTGKVGNYADTSASHLLANHLQAYEDGFPVSSPVGSFQPNGLGLYDLGGNVAEWSHDYYAIHPRSNREAVMDPLGPADGKHHVIRGSSWRHASISELRLSYRDYSDQGRPDLGFRIARYAD